MIGDELGLMTNEEVDELNRKVMLSLILTRFSQQRLLLEHLAALLLVVPLLRVVPPRHNTYNL